jgi:NAD(P)-dependent dehydrogenase (short-subunit alcohol dehydrogenase family)
VKLKDRVALITGAARGIGLAIAERFVAEGAIVTIADILDDEGKAAAARIGARYVHCDMSKTADVMTTIAGVVKTNGAIDVLVNNAAISIAKDFLEITEADFDKVLAINVKRRHQTVDGGVSTGAGTPWHSCEWHWARLNQHGHVPLHSSDGPNGPQAHPLAHTAGQAW